MRVGNKFKSFPVILGFLTKKKIQTTCTSKHGKNQILFETKSQCVKLYMYIGFYNKTHNSQKLACILS